MRFTRSNAYKYGRRGGLATAAKRNEQKQRKRAEQIRKAEEEAFARFQNAERGYFNGFEFSGVFHEQISKADALFSGISDDAAECEGVNVGADGVKVYFYCLPENAKKIVSFNKSVYVF